jgi:hypothetical protein
MDSYSSSLEKKTAEETLLEYTNYWKEAHKEIHEILQDFKGIMLLTHNSIEFTDIVDFLNKVRPGKFLNLLYISLIRSYDYMTVVLLRKQLENKRIFFIDCVSGYAFPSEEEIDDCFYHKPPHTLNEMKELITFGIKNANPEIIVIDPLSQFINFSQPTEGEINDLYTFLKSLKDALGIMQNTFILLYDSKLRTMQHLPKISADLILKVEVVKEEARWKD